jgi:hypothetical protein
METPLIDWHGEYCRLDEKYQALDREAIRLESKLHFWQAEAATLQAQLARLTATTPGVCELCGRPFQQQHDGRKRKYCGDACKTKACREKKLIAELEQRMRERSDRALLSRNIP